jgi:low temperature requirement protein LtrA
MRKLMLMSACLLLTNLYSFAQDFSNKGRDFWVAYGYHQVMTTGNSQDMVLYFATEAATNVTVSIRLLILFRQIPFLLQTHYPNQERRMPVY